MEQNAFLKHLSDRWHRGQLVDVTSGYEVVITFDDGPQLPSKQRVLAVLAPLRPVPAPRQVARKCPELVRRVACAGPHPCAS